MLIYEMSGERMVIVERYNVTITMLDVCFRNEVFVLAE